MIGAEWGFQGGEPQGVQDFLSRLLTDVVTARPPSPPAEPAFTLIPRPARGFGGNLLPGKSQEDVIFGSLESLWRSPSS